MKCTKAKKRISEYIDGGLDREKTSALEKHLETCRGCRKLLADFRQIKQKAKGLKKTDPSSQTWFRIQERLNEKAQAPVPGPRVRFLFFPARLRYVMGAVLLLVAAGAVIVGLRVWNRGDTAFGSGQEYALAKVREAEQHYKLAIKALWEAAQAQQANFDPKIAEMFRLNLELIDASLDDCRRAVADDPGDMESQYYLLSVYKKKAELLDSMIEISSTSPKKKETETII